MHIHPVPAADLTPRQIAAWSRLQLAAPDCDSPLLSPEFTQLAARHRDAVEVAVIEQAGELAGFFPYRREGGAAMPVAGTLTDMQAVIADGDLAWAPEEILNACRLRALYFDHWPAEQAAMTPHHWSLSPSPFMEVGGGFDAYQRSRANTGSDLVKQTLRKMRKIEREIGPLHFAAHTTDEDAFQMLLDWKSAQYQRTHRRNLFAQQWIVELIDEVVHTTGERFGGMLSTLSVGDRLIAVHLGMLAGGLLHSWFPAYDVELSKYSPGLMMFVKLAQEAQSLGVRRIELGRGGESYKESFKSGDRMLAVGAVDRRPLVRPLRRWWLQSKDGVCNSRWQTQARIVYRSIASIWNK